MPRVGARRKKSRTQKVLAEGETEETGPCCLIIKQGEVGHKVGELVRDIRQIFAPNTFMNLKESKRNRLRDFVTAAGSLGATHMINLSKTDLASYLRMNRLPQGPTTTFKIDSFSLGSDIRSSSRKPRGLNDKDYLAPPMLIMNGFEGDQVSQLLSTQLKGMFPAIDVPTVNLKSLRRVLLANFDPKTNTLILRHFAVSIRNASVSRPVRKLIQKKKVPSLGHVEDVAQVISEGIGYQSESEIDEFQEVGVMPGVHSRSCPSSSSLAVRLVELGPRVDLSLVKIEAGLNEGHVLYHRYVTKSAEEADRSIKEASQKKALQERQQKLADERKVQKEELKAKMRAKKLKKFVAQAGDEEDDGKEEKGDAEEKKGIVEFNDTGELRGWKNRRLPGTRKDISKDRVLKKFRRTQKK